jgi:uncharacterized protein YjbJ (UPF0337 family)
MSGQTDKAKGRIKQAAGDLSGNNRLKTEGKADEARGTVKEKVSHAADKVKKSVNQ